jgi:hypothetical protein
VLILISGRVGLDTSLEIRRLHFGYQVRRLNICCTSISAIHNTWFFASAVSICTQNISMVSASGFPHCWEWICTGVRNRLYGFHSILTVHMLWHISLCFMCRVMYMKEQAYLVLWTQKLKFSILTFFRFFKEIQRISVYFAYRFRLFIHIFHTPL